jgi:hypothetical protein
MQGTLKTLALTLVAAALMTACGKSGDTTTETTTSEAALPSTLFVATAPADAVPLAQAKAAAAPGERIVFEAKVGGRKEAFVAQRAVFFVVDGALKSCTDLHPGTCATPWDYCCEPPDSLTANMATVQIVGDDGRPLAVSLDDNLEPLSTVVIAGTVGTIDDAGNFVVNADAIHVRGG